MNSDRISSLVWLAVGLVTVYGSFPLGLGTLREPGPGFLAFLAGSFVSLIAIIIFLQSFIRWRGVSLDLAVHWEGSNWHRTVIIGLLTFGEREEGNSECFQLTYPKSLKHPPDWGFSLKNNNID